MSEKEAELFTLFSGDNIEDIVWSINQALNKFNLTISQVLYTEKEAEEYDCCPEDLDLDSPKFQIVKIGTKEE